MIIVGIDPGLTGAMALLHPAAATVYDMPRVDFFETGFVKQAINLPALTSLIGSYEHFGLKAFIEKTSSRGGQGVASMFSMGMSMYGPAGVCAGLNIPVTYVQPKEWKAHFGLDKDKKKSMALARKLFPDLDLHLEKHHNRAEALLIAQYAKEKLV